MYYLVAPRVGAWIETRCQIGILNEGRVAPRVGAWIETYSHPYILPLQPVAPRVGAWIETAHALETYLAIWSHPEWVRGLKLMYGIDHINQQTSHPEWVRGLKPTC